MKPTRNYKQHFTKYLAVFIVPILSMTTFFLYDNAISNKRLVEDYNFGLLTQFNNEIDLYISELQNCALSISNAAHFDSGSNSRHISDTDILSLLNSYKDNLSEYITPAYYPRASQNIIIDEDVITYSDFEKSNYYQFSLSLSGLFVRLNNVNSQYILSLEQNSNNVSPYSYSTAILYPVPLIAARPDATLCFLIQGQFFLDIQNKYFTHMPSQISILDGTHKLLYSDSNSIFDQNELSGLVKNYRIGISNIKIDGKKYVLMRSVSPTTGCNYISVTPYSMFYAHGKENMELLAALVALLIIFSVLMALTLTKNFFFSIANIETQNKEITVELNSRNHIIREMVLRRIIFGSISDGDTKNMYYNLQCANIEFPYPFFTVAVCQINNFFTDEKLYEKAIAQLENCTIPHAVCFPIKLAEENQITVIVNSFTDNNIQTLLAEMIYEICSQLFIEHFRIGCGSTYPSFFKVDTSYIEANVAIDKRTNKSKDRCYLFDNNFDTSNQNYTYPYLEHAIIEQSIRNGNTQAALQSLHSIFDRIEQMAPSMIIRQCLNYDVINMAAKIAQSLNVPLTPREIAGLSTWNTFEEFYKKIENIISDISDKTSELKKLQNMNTKHSLIDYVQNHYRENTLSLDLLAGHFNLSYSYISKIFKDETNQTFSSYVTELRFKYVKQQLVQTDMPIKNIIKEAGYIDAANFMRKFKQNEGMTLGQYRQLYPQKKG